MEKKLDKNRDELSQSNYTPKVKKSEAKPPKKEDPHEEVDFLS